MPHFYCCYSSANTHFVYFYSCWQYHIRITAKYFACRDCVATSGQQLPQGDETKHVRVNSLFHLWADDRGEGCPWKFNIMQHACKVCSSPSVHFLYMRVVTGPTSKGSVKSDTTCHFNNKPFWALGKGQAYAQSLLCLNRYDMVIRLPHGSWLVLCIAPSPARNIKILNNSM